MSRTLQTLVAGSQAWIPDRVRARMGWAPAVSAIMSRTPFSPNILQFPQTPLDVPLKHLHGEKWTERVSG